MELEKVISVSMNYGAIGLILFFVGFALWKWGWYVLTEILRPVSVEVIEFLRDLKREVQKLTGWAGDVSSKLDDHGKKLDEHGRKIDKLLDRKD